MTRHYFFAVLSALLLPAFLPKVALAQSVSSGGPPAPANHDASSVASSPRTKSQRHWYGGTILAADTAALVMGIGAIGAAGSRGAQGFAWPLVIGASVTYLADGPIVHAAQGRTGAAFGSLGLRLGTPLVGAGVGGLVGAAAEGDCSGEALCGIGTAVGAIMGFGAGMVVASIVDIAGLAYADEPNSSTLRVALAPHIDQKKGTVGLNLVGSW